MMTFEAWPKIPRWNREVVITEKIDGTNAAIVITPVKDVVGEEAFAWGAGLEYAQLWCDRDVVAWVDDFAVYAQSRNRMITPIADNFGFAAWVQANADELVKLLGPGRHFGEWYGAGIGRKYGLDHKRFALFSPHWWINRDLLVGSNLPVDAVPRLGTEPDPSTVEYGQYGIDYYLHLLETRGSVLVPGFRNPEGIILYHTAARQSFKITLKGDDVPKGRAA